MFKCVLCSLLMDRGPGTFYLKAPDCAPGRELHFSVLITFTSSLFQMFKYFHLSSSAKFTNYLAKQQNTKRPGTLAGKGMKVKAMF